MRDPTHSPEPVLQHIQGQLKNGRSWRVPVDRIPGLLDIDHTEFYRRVYTAVNSPGGTVEYSTLTQTFDQDSVGELLGVLELFCGPKAEEAFTSFGLFIPHALRVELTSILLETARIEAAGHLVDTDAFEAMLRTFRSYESARDTYFAEYLSREQLVRSASERFVQDRGFRFPGLALQTATDVLESLFSRRILELETVLWSIGAALFEIAVAAGYARRYEEETTASGQEDDDDSTAGSTVLWAYTILEIDPEHSDISMIKRAYKRLMLRYHPDVNPRGLNKAKEINRAYSVLLEAVR